MMKWMDWKVAIVLAAVLLIVGCSLCGDEVASQTKSPNGRLQLTVFYRDCGATTDYATLVSLHSPSDKFSDRDDLIFTANGRYLMEVHWQDNANVRIVCPRCKEEEVFFEAAKKGGIRFTYEFGSATTHGPSQLGRLNPPIRPAPCALLQMSRG